MAKTNGKSPAYPAVGTKAPDFQSPASGGKTVRLSDLKGKTVVLYFYPKDNTSGCTKEACGFRDAWNKFKQAGVEVLGVSPDSAKSHDNFAGKFNLPFTLVSDEDKSICQAYGVWQEKAMYGRKYFGVARTTFVIDKTGKIAHIFEKVKAAGHEEEALGWIKENL